MVLYHCVSAYHVLQAMVHKKRRHETERAVLLLADFSAKKFDDYRELSSFFDEVFLIPYRGIRHDTNTLIGQTAAVYERTVPYPVTEFEDIYVAAAHYYFSLYLVNEGVHFHFMEDGAGILSKPKVSYDIVMKYAPLQANIAQTYGMFDGTNPYVTDRICNVGAQSFALTDSNIVDFDLTAELAECEKEYRDRILLFFRVEKLEEDLRDTALVFTQQLANLGIVSFEEQIAVYQLAIDFFLPDKKILFKVHPDDIMFYSLLFPESRVLNGRYPAELLPFLSDGMAATAMTVFSSSVLGIKSAFCRNIFCGYDFDKTYDRIDSYYFALDLLGGLPAEEYEFYGCGVDINLVENLLHYSLPAGDAMHFTYPGQLPEVGGKKSVILIDDIRFFSDAFRNKAGSMEFDYEPVEVYFPGGGTLDGLPEETKQEDTESVTAECGSAGMPSGKAKIKQCGADTEKQDEDRKEPEITEDDVREMLKALPKDHIAVFVNTQEDYCFYDYEDKYLFERMLPVRLEHRKVRREHVYYKKEASVIYFYTDDQEVREMIKQYRKKKKLVNTGISAEVHQMSDEQRKIAVLEGMLQATERRLLYYINKEKEEREK